MSERGTRDRRERRRGPGILSALAGAALLVVVGFALGVVSGLVLEEPDLVVDYLAGRTQTIELAPGAGSDVAARPPAAAPSRAAAADETEAPPPAASTGTVEAEAKPSAAAAPGAAAADAPTAPAAEAIASTPAVPEAGFAVQVGAFADAAAAEQLARRLGEHGFPVYVAPALGGDEARWRVRVGPLSSRDEASRMADRLEREERLGTWVLAEGPR